MTDDRSQPPEWMLIAEQDTDDFVPFVFDGSAWNYTSEEIAIAAAWAFVDKIRAPLLARIAELEARLAEIEDDAWHDRVERDALED